MKYDDILQIDQTMQFILNRVNTFENYQKQEREFIQLGKNVYASMLPDINMTKAENRIGPNLL